MKRLHELEPGTRAVIRDIEGDINLKKKLLSMGLTKGIKVKVTRNAPLKDPMEVEVRGYNLSLRKYEARNIVVEVVR